MYYRTLATVGALAFALAGTACSSSSDANRDIRDNTVANEPVPDRAIEQQRERDHDVAQIDERLIDLQRDYEEQMAARPRGTSGSTASARLHDEVSKEITDLKQAVMDLRSTTADNWWDRHERAMKTAIDDVDADVRKMTGLKAAAKPADRKIEVVNGEAVSTAPFTSRRDRFVTDVQARIDGWKASLDKVKAKGARQTELDDLKARVNKLDDDVDHLKAASADDWWDLSKARVNDYIERVQKSVARLDDNR